ncbi:hypothetical protein [Vibrio variabilis]|uniref:hypothetical protein n=1 Tax=Vibrio variabilis TaxID=990271 RepID=UPI000DDA9751|nr:hypothetical protein [Vibrio variabilis]
MITLVSLAPAGKWMEQHGSQALWLVTIIINLFVAVVMWGMYGNQVVAILPLSLILLSIINGAWNDISIAALADQISLILLQHHKVTWLLPFLWDFQ